MAAQTFSIEFDGYWRERNKGGIPKESGVYCVYSCVHNVSEKTVSIKKLIYIGECVKLGSNLHNSQINAPRMGTAFNISISSGMGA